MTPDPQAPANRSVVNRRLHWIWVWALLGLAAPHQHLRAQVPTRPLTGYVSPNVAHLRLTRALFLPTENQTQHKRFEETIHELLETELRSIQLFHVVDCPESACGSISVPQLCQGRFPMARIAELRNRYHADMIIASAITEFHPYRYPKIGFELHIIETSNAETIASFSGIWDSRVQRIAQQACQHFRSQSRGGAFCNGELVLQSPRYFTEYVTRDLAHSLAELWAAQTGTAIPPPELPSGNGDTRVLPLVGSMRTRIPTFAR